MTGTVVKEQSYDTGLAGEVFAEFGSRLRQNKTLVCCGYGWGDRGINRRIADWFYETGHRLVILQGKPESRLLDTSFGRDLDDHQRSGKIVLIERFLDQCSLADLEEYFDS